MSEEAIERRHRFEHDVLRRVRAIDRAALGPADRLDAELFERLYADRVAEHRFHAFLLPLDSLGGVQLAHELADALVFETKRDYKKWILRLERIGTYVDQTIAAMRRGIAEGRVHPKVVLERVREQIEAQIVDDPEKSPFFRPFLEIPDEMTRTEKHRLVTAARLAIESVVVPAFRRLARFFDEEALPAARDTVGAWALPRGEEWYAFRVRHFTTTSLTPEEIHRLGLEEVRRIRGEMEAIVREVGFPGSFDAFLERLRTDRRFTFDDPEELLEAYRATAKRIDPELVRLFGTLPRMPYGVRPIPPGGASHATTAYYAPPAADGSRAGIVFVNVDRPETRPRYEIEVLTAHEAVPGHHLQTALAMELPDVPAFRRYLGEAAFVEGWALYAESLGSELGLYRDPYSRFGRLTYEMWRAARLVVDTGIHALRWDRERALDFFRRNAARTEQDIVDEVDREIAWPGQALAYKIGELEIRRLRREAERRLGPRFDVRRFHDAVLSQGAVPLDVLERIVDELVAREGAPPP